MSAVV